MLDTSCKSVEWDYVWPLCKNEALKRAKSLRPKLWGGNYWVVLRYIQPHSEPHEMLYKLEGHVPLHTISNDATPPDLLRLCFWEQKGRHDSSPAVNGSCKFTELRHLNAYNAFKSIHARWYSLNSEHVWNRHEPDTSTAESVQIPLLSCGFVRTTVPGSSNSISLVAYSPGRKSAGPLEFVDSLPPNYVCIQYKNSVDTSAYFSNFWGKSWLDLGETPAQIMFRAQNICMSWR